MIAKPKTNIFIKIGVVIMFCVFIALSLNAGIKSINLWQKGEGVAYLICGSAGCSGHTIFFSSPEWKVNFFAIFNIIYFIFVVPIYFGYVLTIITSVFMSFKIKFFGPKSNSVSNRLLWISPFLLYIIYITAMIIFLPSCGRTVCFFR